MFGKITYQAYQVGDAVQFPGSTWSGTIIAAIPDFEASGETGYAVSMSDESKQQGALPIETVSSKLIEPAKRQTTITPDQDSSYQHTPRCIEETARLNQAIEAYKYAWPNYCQHCNGAGVFVSYYDPSPPGISLGSGYMTDIDPCESCTQKGLCPRCGAKVWAIDDDEIPETPCLECGWNWDKNAGDVMPQPYECACYEQWEHKQEYLSQEDVEHARNGYGASEQPYTCYECGVKLSFPETIFFDQLTYCKDHYPMYDRHQQW